MANPFFLSKNISSFRFSEDLLDLDNFEKYFLIYLNSCISSS